MIAAKEIWIMVVGVVFFLMAMDFMEKALGKLAGRKFKLFLKNNLNNRFKSITGSAIVTSILQSSSIVNLLVLSLVGSGVVQLQNALGLLLGSNFGTTINSWIVVTLGFQLNIQSLIMPIAGVAGMGMIFLKKETRFQLWSTFLFSLALLFIGLDQIKSGMENFVLHTDLTAFLQYPLIFYLFLGVLLTALVQSSAATIAITLSALFANAITLPIGMSVILGAEIGTTLKLFLAAYKGEASKKRVALANFIINTITALVVFAFLKQTHILITEQLQIKNSLFALAFFQSFINIVSIILFAPFLNKFADFLAKCYTKGNSISLYIHKFPTKDIQGALAAFEKETKHFIFEVLDYSSASFALEKEFNIAEHKSGKTENNTMMDPYEKIKFLHGEMYNYYFLLKKKILLPAQSEKLEQLIKAIRNFMYAAKNIQDAKADILQTSNSSNDFKFNFYHQSRKSAHVFYEKCTDLLENENEMEINNKITALLNSITEAYTVTVQSLYNESLTTALNQIEISTLINFNRELYTSFKSILFGLSNFLLSADEVVVLESSPGFIR